MRLQLLFYILTTIVENTEVFSKCGDQLEVLDGDSYNTGIISIFSTTELKNLLQWDDFEANNWISKDISSKDAVDSTTVNKIDGKDHLFMLEFVAEWCGLCKSIQHLVEVCYIKTRFIC